MEGRAGVRLIPRTTRALSPTEEAVRLLIDVERALGAIEASEDRLAGARDATAGTLKGARADRDAPSSCRTALR